MTGRLLESHPQTGLARSFACGNCTHMCTQGYLTPYASLLGGVSTNATLGNITVYECVTACTRNCGGTRDGKIDSFDSFNYSWTNNSIVSTTDGYSESATYTINAPGTGSVVWKATIPDETPVCQAAGGAPTTGTPVITGLTPDFALVGSTGVQITINGNGFGNSPTVNLPSGFVLTSQGSTPTRIVATVNISINASPGWQNLSVTANGQPSNNVQFLADAPDHMLVYSDTIGPCDEGCHTTIQRVVWYQVINKSGVPGLNLNIGEVVGWNLPSWNCTQTFPGLNVSLCGEGATTNSSGMFPDRWTLASDVYTPIGCGITVVQDTWEWCGPTNHIPFGNLYGYVHTNQIEENGYANPPTKFPNGLRINP